MATPPFFCVCVSKSTSSDLFTGPKDIFETVTEICHSMYL